MSQGHLVIDGDGVRLQTADAANPVHFLSVTGSLDTVGYILGNGQAASFDISLPGAQLGDAVVWGSDIDLAGCTVTASVSAANLATVDIFNGSGVSATINSLFVYLMEQH